MCVFDGPATAMNGDTLVGSAEAEELGERIITPFLVAMRALWRPQSLS